MGHLLPCIDANTEKGAHFIHRIEISNSLDLHSCSSDSSGALLAARKHMVPEIPLPPFYGTSRRPLFRGIIMSSMAVANANLKPGDAMTWKRPYFPSWLHVLFGMATILIGYITLFQGLQIFNIIFTGTTKVGGGLMVAYVIVNLSATGCLIAYLWEKYSTCD
jgi:hypothetical protein